MGNQGRKAERKKCFSAAFHVSRTEAEPSRRLSTALKATDRGAKVPAGKTRQQPTASMSSPGNKPRAPRVKSHPVDKSPVRFFVFFKAGEGRGGGEVE